jgi:uncharacterized membrane protein YedE/YeeE
VQHFTPLSALGGGLLIGLASAVILFATGRVVGVSGILGGIVAPSRGDAGWRLTFVLGLLASGALMAHFSPERFSMQGTLSTPFIALAGVLVGFGTRMSGGCTSGHGVCGLSRFSGRSLIATLTFMFSAGVTVFVARHLLGVG